MFRTIESDFPVSVLFTRIFIYLRLQLKHGDTIFSLLIFN